MVSSYSELLARRYRGKLDARADKYIGYAVDAAHRMHAMIEHLLDFSRLQTGAREFAPVDCREAYALAVSNLRAAVAASGVCLTCDILPTVVADSAQLARVLQNLISNALKFRGGDAPQIHVGAKRAHGEWQFSVRDNGIGMESRHCERIFAIFQRLHRRDQYPGSGIGLAICKNIIERHGGRIWAEASPGRGTTVHFTLPDRAAAASAALEVKYAA